MWRAQDSCSLDGCLTGVLPDQDEQQLPEASVLPPIPPGSRPSSELNTGFLGHGEVTRVPLQGRQTPQGSACRL